MDVFSKRKRSQIMSRIRSSGGPAERRFRRLVREVYTGRLRYNDPGLPGSPDVVIRRLRVAIFFNGCFWHACPEHGRRPKTRVQFWRDKLRKNVARDRRAARELRRMGWNVWTVWEHSMRPDAVARTRQNLSRRIRRLERKSAQRPCTGEE